MTEKTTYRDNLELLMRLYPTAAVPISKAAEIIGVSEYVLYQDETFPKQKIGGRWYVSLANLARWLSV